jgi:hypothetical protein
MVTCQVRAWELAGTMLPRTPKTPPDPGSAARGVATPTLWA